MACGQPDFIRHIVPAYASGGRSYGRLRLRCMIELGQPPIADAGAGQAVNHGQWIMLDESGSSDPDFDKNHTAKLIGPQIKSDTFFDSDPCAGRNGDGAVNIWFFAQ